MKCSTYSQLETILRAVINMRENCIKYNAEKFFGNNWNPASQHNILPFPVVSEYRYHKKW